MDISNIFVELEMLVNTHLKGKYYGNLELNETLDSLLERLKQVNPDRIHLTVTFPSQDPLPILTKLTLNGLVMCHSPPGKIYGAFQTFTVGRKIEFSVSYLSELNQQQQQIGNCLYGQNCNEANRRSNPHHPIFEVPIPQATTLRTTTTTRIISAPFPEPLKELVVPDSEICGKPVFSGIESRGKWPWLIAIFWAPPNLKYACGGTLVSNKHVLTAASCLLDSPTKRTNLPRDLLVYVGKHNLNNFAEENSYAKEVGGVSLHPSATSSGAIIDLAVITFKHPVKFDDFVRPICLNEITNQNFMTSLLSGWGTSQVNTFDYPLEPKEGNMTISKDKSMCTNSVSSNLNYDHVICAFSASLILGVCKDDRGGGLYQRDVISNRWFLQGVAVLANWNAANPSCDPSSPVLFTDLRSPPVRSWIYQTIAFL